MLLKVVTPGPLKIILPIAAMLLAVLAAVVYWGVTEKTSRGKRGVGISSRAVFPFVNISSDQGNEYFSDGLTDELINALAKVEGLQVAARGSVFQLKGKPQDIRKVSQLLNVGAVLKGSVRKEKDKLQVTAELSQAMDGFELWLWTETYEGEVKDVFAIQEQIARAIVNALQIRLQRPKKAVLVKQGTKNLEACDLVLKGRKVAW